MSQSPESQPTPWRKSDFGPEDVVPDDRAICPDCHGAGRIREWSTPFALIGLAGFGGAVWLAYLMFVEGQRTTPNIRFFVILLCVGIFGSYVCFDRAECKRCSGLGKLDPDEDDDGAEPHEPDPDEAIK
jgi:hypothetical protein